MVKSIIPNPPFLPCEALESKMPRNTSRNAMHPAEWKTQLTNALADPIADAAVVERKAFYTKEGTIGITCRYDFYKMPLVRIYTPTEDYINCNAARMTVSVMVNDNQSIATDDFVYVLEEFLKVKGFHPARPSGNFLNEIEDQNGVPHMIAKIPISNTVERIAELVHQLEWLNVNVDLENPRNVLPAGLSVATATPTTPATTATAESARWIQASAPESFAGRAASVGTAAAGGAAAATTPTDPNTAMMMQISNLQIDVAAAEAKVAKKREELEQAEAELEAKKREVAESSKTMIAGFANMFRASGITIDELTSILASQASA